MPATMPFHETAAPRAVAAMFVHVRRRLYMAGVKATLGVCARAFRLRAWWRARHPPLLPAAELDAAFGCLRVVSDARARMPFGFENEVAAVLAGRVTLYGQSYCLGPHPDWLADPVTGLRLDPAVQGFDSSVDDIKRVWKLSCAHHLLPVAALAAVQCDGAAATFVLQELDDWISANPPGKGPNWHSPTAMALRLASWSLILLLLRERLDDASETARERIHRSLVSQGNHLYSHLEDMGLRSNHYVACLTGLYILCLCFDGLPGAHELRRRMAALLRRAIGRQICGDGVHREFSCHYHRLVTELFLLPMVLARAAGANDFPPTYESHLRSMVGVLRSMANSGVILPQIGDNDSEIVWCVGLESTAVPCDIRPFLRSAAAGIVAAPGTDGRLPISLVLTLLGLSEDAPGDVLADAPGGKSEWRAWSSAGWHVWRSGEVELLAVCGPVGLLGLGSHDHAHVNEVLLSLGGREVIVDPGTGCYTGDPELRNRLRSATAHSTVFTGREPASWQSGVDGLFHMEEIWHAKARLSGDNLAMQASYRGVTHDRTVRPGATRVRIEDRVNRLLPGAFLQWVLHPDVRVIECRGGVCRVRMEGFELKLIADAGAWEMAAVDYSPRFGQRGTTQAARLWLQRPICSTIMEISRD